VSRLQFRRVSLWLCLLLVTAQALLPRDLVCCHPANGQPGLELSIHGHCLGKVAGTEAGHCCTVPSIESAEQIQWQPLPDDCQDIAIHTADSQLVRLQPLAAPQATAEAILPGGYVWSARQLSRCGLQLEALHPACGYGPPPPVTSRVLRI
jgi:hypothetical protein